LLSEKGPVKKEISSRKKGPVRKEVSCRKRPVRKEVSWRKKTLSEKRIPIGKRLCQERDFLAEKGPVRKEVFPPDTVTNILL